MGTPMAPLTPDRPFLANVLQFMRMLHCKGIPISLEQSIDFPRALELINIGKRDQVYHTARSLLIRRKADFELFDRVFAWFWQSTHSAENSLEPQKAPVAPRHNVQNNALSL